MQKELQDNRRGVGPWNQSRTPRLGLDRDNFSGFPLSRIPEPSAPGIMPLDQFVKEVVVPFGQRIVAAQDRVTSHIGNLLEKFPDLNGLSLNNPRGLVLAAETAGFANAEQLMYATTLRDRYEGLKNQVDRRLSQLSARSLAPGVPVVILDTFYPKDKATGSRHPNKRNIVYAAGGTVGGLTLAGIILKACEAVASGQGNPTNPTIPVGPSPFPGITPTPEGGIGVHPLVVVCPNPTQMGDQKYPLSQYTPRMQGVVEFKNTNSADTALATQMENAINKRFGPNDLVICSPAYGEGVSPVISVYPFDNAGGGNFKWYVMLEDGRLVGPQEDRLFTPDNKWVQADDVAHYSLGRVGEGKFDTMVYTAPRKNATDPEVIVGILDRTSGRVFTGQEMIDKYGGVFSNVPFAILASLDQFRQSIPANLLSQVDHFGYVPTPTPDGKTGLKLAALRSDGTVVLAQGQEAPKATITPNPSPTPKPTETLAPTATPEPKVPKLEDLSPNYFFQGSDSAQVNKNNDNWTDWYRLNTAGNASYTVMTDADGSQFIRFFQTGPAVGSSKQVRAELDATGPIKDGNIAVQLDFRIGSGIPRGNFNLLTTAGRCCQVGGGAQLLANVNFDENRFLTTYVYDPNGDDYDHRILYASDVRLTTEQWHTLELRAFGKSNNFMVILDGKPVSFRIRNEYTNVASGEPIFSLPNYPNVPWPGFSYIHGGYYAYRINSVIPLENGNWIDNRKLRVATFK